MDCRQTSPVNWRFSRVSVVVVPLINRVPKAVPPVVLVASKPRARLELFAGPKLF